MNIPQLVYVCLDLSRTLVGRSSGIPLKDGCIVVEAMAVALDSQGLYPLFHKVILF